MDLCSLTGSWSSTPIAAASSLSPNVDASDVDSSYAEAEARISPDYHLPQRRRSPHICELLRLRGA